MSSELSTQRHGAALVLTLSDPATRNALSPQLCVAGVEALNVAESDAGVRVVILRGEGAHFCSGSARQHLARWHGEGPQAARHAVEQLHGFIEALQAFPKPVVAAVEGDAADSGFSLALACDLIVAAEDAKFVLSQPGQGLTPEGGALWPLAQALPRPRLLEIAWLGEPLGAAQMSRLGLVQRVAAAGQAFAEAQRLAQRLAQTTSPELLAALKELAVAAPQRSLHAQLDAERDQLLVALQRTSGV